MSNEEENGIEDIVDDIDDIGEDTDVIISQIAQTLNELVTNTKETKSTKKLVWRLFIIDKLIMLALMITSVMLGMKLGGL